MCPDKYRSEEVETYKSSLVLCDCTNRSNQHKSSLQRGTHVKNSNHDGRLTVHRHAEGPATGFHFPVFFPFCWRNWAADQLISVSEFMLHRLFFWLPGKEINSDAVACERVLEYPLQDWYVLSYYEWSRHKSKCLACALFAPHFIPSPFFTPWGPCHLHAWSDAMNPIPFFCECWSSDWVGKQPAST